MVISAVPPLSSRTVPFYPVICIVLVVALYKKGVYMEGYGSSTTGTLALSPRHERVDNGSGQIRCCRHEWSGPSIPFPSSSFPVCFLPAKGPIGWATTHKHPAQGEWR